MSCSSDDNTTNFVVLESALFDNFGSWLSRVTGSSSMSASKQAMDAIAVVLVSEILISDANSEGS